MDKNSSSSRMEKRHGVTEIKKRNTGIVKYVLIAVAAVAVIVAGIFIFLSMTQGYVATVGKEKLATKEFKFYLMTQKQNIRSLASQDPNYKEETFWSTNINGETALQLARKRALQSMQDAKIQLDKAKAAKISLTTAEIKKIDDDINTNIIKNENYGNGNRAKADSVLMKNYGFGIDDLRKVQIDQATISKFQLSEADKMGITTDKVKEYYDKNPDWYKNSEMRTGAAEAVWARHILIKAASDATQEVKDAAKKKAQDLLDKLKAGADFATLAKENSEDGGSAEYGGEYVFSKGVGMDSAFETAAFSLNPGQIYDTLVETSFGYHIIKLEEKIAKDAPVSLKCATEYHEYGTGFIKSKLYQNKLTEWEKDTAYKATPNAAVYNSIDIP